MRDQTDVANNTTLKNEEQQRLEPKDAIAAEDASSTKLKPPGYFGSPYKGLNPYTERDHSIFFGRERDIQKVVNSLLAWRFTVLYGKSGVGKSSILRAGVTHLLREEAQQNFEDFGVPKLGIVVFPSLDGKFCWTGDPLTSLIQEMNTNLALDGWNPQSPDPDLSFVATLQHWIDALGGEYGDGHLYIILDQFEEYFLYHPPGNGNDSFAETLCKVATSSLQVNFLFSMREDALASLDSFQKPIPGLSDHRITIGHLDEFAARDAIVKPIEYYNHQHTESINIEPELVDSILDEIQVGKVLLDDSGIAGIDAGQRRSEHKQIETPFLQLVMTRLWEEERSQGSNRLRLATFEALGEADQIVKDHLNRQMHLLTNEEKHIAANLFQHLVTSSGTKYAYSAPDLADITGFSTADIHSLLEKLARGDNRILRTEGRVRADATETQSYVIFHDSLASAILAWRRKYLEQEERRSEILKQRKQLRRGALWFTGLAVAGTALVVGTITGIEIVRQRANNLITEQRLESIEAVQRAEQGAQLDALRDAMQIAQAIDNQSAERIRNFTISILQKIGVDIQDLDASKPAVTLALQQILSTIQQERQFSALGEGMASVSQAALSPVGDRAATASPDGTVSIWTLDGTPEHQFQTQDGALTRLMFVADGEQLATAGMDGTFSIWDLEGHQIAQGQLPEDAGWVLGFSSDGTRLATGSQDGTLTVWSVEGERLAVFPNASDGWILNATFNLDGNQLTTASGNIVRLWDISNARLLHTYATEAPVFFTLFTPDGQHLVTAGQAGNVSTWSTESGQREYDFQTQQGAIYHLSLSPDGTQVATASADGSVHLWEVKGDRLAELKGHENLVTGISFMSNNQIATITQSGTVRMWRVQEQRGFPAYSPDTMLFFARVQYSPDRQSLVTSSDRGITQWDLPSVLQNQEGLIMSRSGMGLSSRFDAEGYPWFVLRTPDQSALTVQTFNPAEDSVVAVFYPPSQGMYWIGELSPNLQWLIAIFFESGGTGLAQLRNVENPNQPAITIPLPEGTLPTSATFSPDSQRLAVATIDGSIRIWDVADLTAGRTGSPQKWGTVGIYASALEFSSDGKYLAAALRNNTAQVWDRQGRLVATLQGHNNPINRIHFSPDGQWLLTSSLDSTARLWDLEGNQVAEYPSRTNSGILDANFNVGGGEVATISMDGYVQLWIIEDFEWLVQKGCNWLQGDSSISSDGQTAQEQLSICDPQSALQSEANRSSLTEAFGYLKHLALSLTQPID